MKPHKSGYRQDIRTPIDPKQEAQKRRAERMQLAMDRLRDMKVGVPNAKRG